MKNYLNTLLAEKNINQELTLKVEGPEWGTNFIPLSVVVEFMLTAPASVQAKMKANLVKIDFNNGNVINFFEYVAKFIAK